MTDDEHASALGAVLADEAAIEVALLAISMINPELRTLVKSGVRVAMGLSELPAANDFQQSVREHAQDRLSRYLAYLEKHAP